MLPILFSLAERYDVNANKPFFPVNSLRLLYFVISDYYTDENEHARTTIGELIPAVEGVFAMRNQYRSEHPGSTPDLERAAAAQPLRDVHAIINTPTVNDIFNQLFAYIYPLQDQLLASVHGQLKKDAQVTDILKTGKTFSPTKPEYLELMLHVRAMDSVVFATLVNQVIKKYAPASTDASPLPENLSASLFFHFHLLYQMNDLVDAVVFASDDLKGTNFSPFHVIRQIAPTPTAAKALLGNTFAKLKKQTKLFPFEPQLQAIYEAFVQELTMVVTK